MNNEKIPNSSLSIAHYELVGGTMICKVNIPWARKIAAYPEVSISLTYTGGTQEQTWKNYDTAQVAISGTYKAVNAGTYTAIFTPKIGYVWRNGRRNAIERTWTIAKRKLTIPTQQGTLTYNKSSQSPSWNNYIGANMTLSGTTSGTAAKSYTVTFTLNNTDNQTWSDGTITDKEVTWKIDKRVLTIPTMSPTTLTYKGYSIKPTWNDYDSGYMTWSGSEYGTDVKSYAVKFSLTDTTNTVWSDNTVTQKSAGWDIDYLQLTAPTLTQESYEYKGAAIEPGLNNFVANWMEKSGDTSATNVGEYTLKVTRKDASNTAWDYGSDTKPLYWEITRRSWGSTAAVRWIVVTMGNDQDIWNYSNGGTFTPNFISGSNWVDKGWMWYQVRPMKASAVITKATLEISRPGTFGITLEKNKPATGTLNGSTVYQIGYTTPADWLNKIGVGGAWKTVNCSLTLEFENDESWSGNFNMYFPTD